MCDRPELPAAPDPRLTSVVELAQDMAGALTPLEAVRAAAVRATEALGATMAAVSVWDRESGRLRVLVNHGELAPGEEELPEDESYPVADFPEIVTYLEERWTTGRLPRAWLQSAENTELHAGHAHPTAGAYCQERAAALRRRGRGCCVVAPIVLHGQAWGSSTWPGPPGRRSSPRATPSTPPCSPPRSRPGSRRPNASPTCASSPSPTR